MVLWSNSFIKRWVSSIIDNYIIVLDYDNYIGVGTINAWECEGEGFCLRV